MITIADYLNEFIEDMTYYRNLRPNTVRAYRYDLQSLSSALVDSLDTITLGMIENWSIHNSASVSTVNRRIAAARRFFRWAIQSGFCQSNPLLAREPLRTNRHLPKPIQALQDRKILDKTIISINQPYKLIFTLLRETGMRVKEVLNLNFADVCLDRSREGLHVYESKNRYDRFVILDDSISPRSIRGLRTWIRNHQHYRDCDPLFVSNRNTRISYSAVYYQWQNICAQAGFVDQDKQARFTIHQLRHTRGTELVEQGVGIEIVQRILGHRDPRSTQGYVELSDHHIRRTLSQFSHLIHKV